MGRIRRTRTVGPHASSTLLPFSTIMRLALSAFLVLAASLFTHGVFSEQVIMSSPQTPTLFDLLTIESTTSIFFSYARETEISQLLVDTSTKNTLLVPTNRAVMALARKPYVFNLGLSWHRAKNNARPSHQDASPVDNNIEMTEQELDERSKDNVLRWVSVHIIPVPLFRRIVGHY